MTSGTSIMIVLNVKLPGWKGPRKITMDNVLIDQTWHKVIQDNLGIRDPYILKGGRHQAEIHEDIRIYYEKFQKQMTKYVISILPMPVGSSPIPIAMPPPIVPVPSVPNRGNKRKAQRTVAQGTSQFDTSAVRYFENGELDQHTIPIRSSVQSPAIIRPMRSNVNANDLKFRTEDTVMGNEMVQGERKIVVDGIRNFITNRISDTDILQVRSELQQLKDQDKYMALSRIASFTAGLLENSFLRNNYVTEL